MCVVCEHELWEEHRALEREFFKPCKKCKKFPGTSTKGTCYHCYAVGNTIDECPECAGKPWSEEFLEAGEVTSPMWGSPANESGGRWAERNRLRSRFRREIRPGFTGSDVERKKLPTKLRADFTRSGTVLVGIENHYLSP